MNAIDNQSSLPSPAAKSTAPPRRVCLLLALAALYTGLDALKPLEIDDAAYERFSRQMAGRPLDPYGFAAFWYDEPSPANEILAPPVLPYHWALVRRLTGERVWLWKLGMLPWAVGLVLALHSLLCRFCPGVEVLGTVLFVLSPAVLPSLNLMLDVPALALGLLALVLFLRAADRDSLALAAWAGLVAGVAGQTKYTGFLAPGAMLLYAATHHRLRLWPAAALVAAEVFVTWEFLTAVLYGRSHFLLALSGGGDFLARFGVLPLLPSYLGGLAPAGVLLGLAALGVRRRWLAMAAAILLAGYVLVTVLDVRFVSSVAASSLLFGPQPAVSDGFQMAEVVFDVYALAGGVVLVLVVRRLLLSEAGPRRPGADTSPRRDTVFLLAWLALEVVGYALLTPFPAARRVLGLQVVLTLLILRLAARTCRTPRRRRALWAVTAASVALGLGFFALDWRGAEVHRRAADAAADWVRDHGGGRAWFVGHWGFQYYARRRGLLPLVPAYDPGPSYVPLPPPSRLRRGDWLVVPADDPWLDRQSVRLDDAPLERLATLRIGAAVPLRTVPCFYGGRVPLEHHEGPRIELSIYRVTADFGPVPQ